MFGRALKPFRDRVFLATKLWATDAEGAIESVKESLGRLDTDHIDLIQFHGDLYTDEQTHDILKPGGVLADMQALRDEGLVRYFGLAAEGANSNLSTLVNSGKFDVLQMQYNLFFQGGYDPSKDAGILVEAENQGMGIAIMRAFTGGTFARWLQWTLPGIEETEYYPKLINSLLSFVLSCPLVDVAIVGMRSANRVDSNCAISDDVASRIDLDELYGRFLRKVAGSDKEVWLATSGRGPEDLSLEY